MNDTLRALFRKTEKARTEAEYTAVAAEAAKLLENPSDYYQYRGYYFLDVDNPYFDPLLSEDAWKKAVEADNWFAPWVIANRYRDGSFGVVDL